MSKWLKKKAVTKVTYCMSITSTAQNAFPYIQYIHASNIHTYIHTNNMKTHSYKHTLPPHTELYLCPPAPISWAIGFNLFNVDSCILHSKDMLYKHCTIHSVS